MIIKYRNFKKHFEKGMFEKIDTLARKVEKLAHQVETLVHRMARWHVKSEVGTLLASWHTGTLARKLH